MTEQTERKRRPSGLSNAHTKSPVRFTITATGVAAIIAATPAVILALRGEPEAEKAYSTLRTATTEATHQLEMRLAKIEGRQEGAVLARLQQQIELLQKENERLRAAQPTRAGAAPNPVEKCPEGRIRVRRRCVLIPKSIKPAVVDQQNQTKAATKAYENEKRRRKAAEGSKRALLEQLEVQKAAPAPTSPTQSLRKLPARLGDVKQDD